MILLLFASFWVTCCDGSGKRQRAENIRRMRYMIELHRASRGGRRYIIRVGNAVLQIDFVNVNAFTNF